VDSPVPVVEVADNADAARTRGPNGKVDPGNTVDGSQVGPQFFVGVVMAALAHQIKVEFRQEERKRIRIAVFGQLTVFGPKTQPVARGFRSEFSHPRKQSLKKAFRTQLTHRQRFGVITEKNVCFRRSRLKGPNGPTPALGGFHRMRPQNAKGIGAPPSENRIEARTQGIGSRIPGSYRARLAHRSILAKNARDSNKSGNLVSTSVPNGTKVFRSDPSGAKERENERNGLAR